MEKKGSQPDPRRTGTSGTSQRLNGCSRSRTPVVTTAETSHTLRGSPADPNSLGGRGRAPLGLTDGTGHVRVFGFPGRIAPPFGIDRIYLLNV